MELICRITDQQALTEREYTTPQGSVEKFASMGFLLQSGSETIYAEMVQEQARKQGALSKDFYYKATLQLQARPWTDNHQQQRYENRITLTKIAAL